MKICSKCSGPTNVMLVGDVPSDQVVVTVQLQAAKARFLFLYGTIPIRTNDFPDLFSTGAQRKGTNTHHHIQPYDLCGNSRDIWA